ncbi:MAG: HAD-IB family hydrolase [Chlamydiia bacterium]|nr:HAD-IB family hydrolase [Chlamydiia bacterium]
MAKRTIAAFDFDGTLTTRDTLIPFILFIKGAPETLWIFLTSIPLLMMYLFGLKSRKELKEFYISQAFKGMSEEKIETLGSAFAEKQLDRYLRTKALEKISNHLDKGHEVVLISANLDTYLIPWGKKHNFHKVLCSEVDLKTRLLKGENCRGEEKVKRLLAWAGPKSNYELWAYGDSKGDEALLKLADHPVYRGI